MEIKRCPALLSSVASIQPGETFCITTTIDYNYYMKLDTLYKDEKYGYQFNCVNLKTGKLAMFNDSEWHNKIHLVCREEGHCS